MSETVLAPMNKLPFVKKEIFAGLALGLVLSLICFLPDITLQFVIPALLVILLIHSFGYRGWLVISLVVLISFPDDFGQNFRLTVQLFSFALVFGKYILQEGFVMPVTFLKDNRLQALLLTMISAVLLSAIFSNSFYISIPHFFRLCVFILFVLIIGHQLKDPGIKEAVFLALFGIGITGSVITIYTFLNHQNQIEMLLTMATVQEGGVFSNRAALSGQLFFAIVSSVYLLYVIKPRYKNWIKAGIVIIVLGMLLANSRGALIGLSVFVLSATFLIDRRKFYIIISTLLTGVLAYYFIPQFEQIIYSYFRANRISENTRYALWDFSGKVFFDNPFTGVGPGMVKYSLPKYLNVDMNSFDGSQYEFLFRVAEIGHSHNFFLFTLSETGLVGLTGALSFISFFLFRCFKLYQTKNSISAEAGLTGGIVLAVVLGMLSRGMVESTGIMSYGWLTRDLMFWIMFVVMLNEYYKSVILKK